ncbi:cyclin-dependent protein kinase inhibitor SMR3 [Arachis duranensis]|uniref:Uncharacterized protein n=2 Tax=Arachis TaxID=3817 RepID=A0A445ECC1_ARAHY|nr:cyclin-dependent protein kinase inhibitor SMR3 [Arachis duranensis]XP_025651836.1 cyclin-dependent protein kinase inhibitor SMR3 [Arachis hypogaea]QHO53713.1 Cyclin-dependent protein kinase inhibitor [Arachis hypogaea]RYR73067.1 hypothetical protein Ahy_A02g007360 [Arachis hypogaea]
MKMGNLEISVACSKPPSSSSSHHNNNNIIDKEIKEEEGGYLEGIIVLSKQRDLESRKEQEEEEEIDVDDDGFKTPTSMDQRIPIESKQCPPAPRKPKPPLLSLKRKPPSSLSPPSCCIVSCRYHPLDLSREVELLFQRTTPQQKHHQLLSSDQIIISKKIRRE